MRRKLVSNTIALIFVLACVVTHAQQPPAASSASIAGRVTDQSGAALPGAVVTLYARDRSAAVRIATVTDASGTYRFDHLAPGEYVLEAGAEGFARVAARVLKISRGSSALAIDIQLEVAGVSEEVVVTASDAPQTVDEVSKAVNVVGRSEIDERDEYSIAEALRTVPGLRLQQFGGPGSFTTIKIRGLRNQDTALLIDGLRFRDVTAPQGEASGFLSDLVATDTGRVEILRGSGSSLYGTNAIGGVLNIVTDEGGGPFRGSLLAEGGGLGYARARAQVAGGAGRSDRFVYSAGVSHLNVTHGIDGDDASRNTSGQARAVLRLSPTTTLTGRVYTADSFAQLNEDPQAVGEIPARGIVEARPVSRAELRRYESGASVNQLNAGAATFLPSANDADNTRAARFFSGALTFTQRPTENFGYSITYHGLATRNTFREGASVSGDPADTIFIEPQGATRNGFEGRTHTLAARADLSTGRRNAVTFGYEFERESFANRTFAALTDSSTSIEVNEGSHAFFIQDQLRLLNERLQLSAAFRMQTFALSAPQFAPSSALYGDIGFVSPPTAYTGDGSVSYIFRTTGTKLRGHVGSGYRKPSLFERFGTFFDTFATAFTPLGDPRLRPERSIAFDAGIDQTLASERVRLSATYFYTRLQEVVGFGPVANDPFNRPFGGYLNTRGGLARGLELSANVNPAASLDLFASYTYTNSDQRQEIIEGGSLRAFGIPDHKLTLVATQRIGRRLYFNFDLEAAGNYLAPVFDNRTFRSRVYRFRPVVKADFGAGYAWPLSEKRTLRLFGKVENVFDREYYESGFRTPGANARAGAALSF